MNTEVSLEDGFGGLVIITEVNPFSLVHAEDDQAVLRNNGDVQVPAVVEVKIECDDDASNSSSLAGFRGFQEEEAENARGYAKLVSSTRRFVPNQSQFKSNCEIGPETNGDTSKTRTNANVNVETSEDGGENTKRSVKGDGILRSVVERERSANIPEHLGSSPCGCAAKMFEVSIGDTEPKFLWGGSQEMLQSDIKRESTPESPGVQCVNGSGAHDTVPKSSSKSENVAKSSRKYNRKSLESAGMIGKNVETDGAGMSSGKCVSTRKSTRKSDGAHRSSGRSCVDSKSCKSRRTVELPSTVNGTLSKRNIGSAKRACVNGGIKASSAAGAAKVGRSGAGYVSTDTGNHLAPPETELRSKSRLVNVEVPVKSGDLPAVPGFNESPPHSVAFKNKRKSSRVRKHPSYANGAPNLPDSDIGSCDHVKIEKPEGEVSREVSDDPCTGSIVKRSSRVIKIPAKFRDQVIFDISKNNVSRQKRLGNSADSKAGAKNEGNQQQQGSETDQLKVDSVFSLADDSIVVMLPSKCEKRSRTDSESSSDLEDRNDVPDSPEMDDEGDCKSKNGGRKRKSAKERDEACVALLAVYRSPTDGKRSSAVRDDGYARFKAWSCKLCPYKTASKHCLVQHLRAHVSPKSNFQCQDCPYMAVSRSSLVVHMRKHTGEKPYKCASCDYSCSTAGALKTHVKYHIGDKQFVCPKCGRQYLTKSHLVVHIRTHTGVKPFSCSYCSYESVTRAHLNRHIRTHTGERPFKCTSCNYSTTRNSVLKVHMQTHEPGKPYQCAECAFSANFPLTLKRHMFEHAVDEHSYKCSHCDFKTALPAMLRDHVRTHSGEKPEPFQCLICDYTHMELHHMRQHMRIHTGKKPFRCVECDYTCTVATNLKRHLMLHSGKWPYRCGACPEKFRLKDLLKRHKKSCHGAKQRFSTGIKGDDEPKKFKCPKCEFTAQYLTRLRAHKKTHTENAPYQCYECGYACNSRSHISMHMRTHTGEKPYKCSECNFATKNTLSLKRHRISHTWLWPFSCNECDQRFLEKVHLDYHKEKGCDCAGLPIKSKGLEGSDPSGEDEGSASPKKIFQRRAVVKKIVRRTPSKNEAVEMGSEEEEDFNLNLSNSDKESLTTTESLLNGVVSTKDLGSRADSHERMTRSATSSLPLKRELYDEIYY